MMPLRRLWGNPISAVKSTTKFRRSLLTTTRNVVFRRRIAVQLELTDEETRALLNLLFETIEADRYPFSPRIRVYATSWRSLST